MFVCHMNAVPEEARKKVSDLLELKLQTLVSYHVDTRNGNQVLWKINLC